MKLLYKDIMGKEINKKAELLYNILKQSPGFDIVNAVEKLGGSVTFVDREELDAGVDAQINVEKGINGIDFKIMCVRQQSEEYMRFCIAHELGHLFLHMLEKNEEGNIELVKDRLCKEPRNFNLYEWEAEEFAACFLMPEYEFRIKVEELNGDVEAIAQLFKVSSQSVIIRCKRLGLIG